jgi:hypothetical protein
MPELLLKLLDWLDKNLAKLILAFGLGYKMGGKGDDKMKKVLLEEETKRKLLENELKVIKNSDGKSDADIVGDVINRSRR